MTRRASFALLMSLGFAFGCELDSSCTRSIDEQGRTVISCPRSEPITLEQAPSDPDALCTPLESGIRCGDERYNAQGQKLEPKPTAPDTMQPPSPSGPSGGGGTHRAACTILPDQVICDDGAQSALSPPLESGSRCLSMKLPGVGRRIVCTDLSKTVSRILIPSNLPSAQTEASCTRLEDQIVCSEGTAIIEAQGLEDPSFCLSPILTQVDPKDVAQCALELEQCDTCTLSPSCEAKLNPKVICEQGVALEAPKPCIAPQGAWRLDDPQTPERLKGCTHVQGDLILNTPKENVGGLLLRGDLRLIRHMRAIKQLNGSLILERGYIPNTTVAREELGELWALLELKVILGELILRDLEGVVELIGAPGVTRFVGGALFLEANPQLIQVELFAGELRWLRGGLYVGANPKMEFFEQPGGKVELKGILAFTENPAFPLCELDDLLVWGLSQGASVLIAATPNDQNLKCP